MEKFLKAIFSDSLFRETVLVSSMFGLGTLTKIQKVASTFDLDFKSIDYSQVQVEEVPSLLPKDGRGVLVLDLSTHKSPEAWESVLEIGVNREGAPDDWRIILYMHSDDVKQMDPALLNKLLVLDIKQWLDVSLL